MPKVKVSRIRVTAAERKRMGVLAPNTRDGTDDGTKLVMVSAIWREFKRVPVRRMRDWKEED